MNAIKGAKVRQHMKIAASVYSIFNDIDATDKTMKYDILL